MNIGIIGLGSMGRHLGANLAAAGYTVRGWNRSQLETDVAPGVTLARIHLQQCKQMLLLQCYPRSPVKGEGRDCYMPTSRFLPAIATLSIVRYFRAIANTNVNIEMEEIRQDFTHVDPMHFSILHSAVSTKSTGRITYHSMNNPEVLNESTPEPLFLPIDVGIPEFSTRPTRNIATSIWLTSGKWSQRKKNNSNTFRRGLG